MRDERVFRNDVYDCCDWFDDDGSSHNNDGYRTNNVQPIYIDRDTSHFFCRDISNDMTKENNYKNVYKFQNGYSASVVCNPTTYGYSMGLFEVAVLDKDGRLCYDTPITSDVEGYLTFQGVADILKDISKLEPRL